TRFFSQDVPKFRIPDNGMPANAACQLIRDEMNLDGNPALNLASFVTTWMEPEADRLFQDVANKNFVDLDEYPQTGAIHQRVINMQARMLNAPEDAKSVGTATVGSSEAIMLGLLAHKWTWKKRRQAEGRDISRPNIIFGADVHSCWEKFALYFDVEMRVIPLEKGKYAIGPDDVEPLVDENTICVGGVVGTTFTGQNDDFKGLNDLLLKIKQDKGWDIPIHVDGASGGFVMAFAFPEVEWDFRLEQVRSINVSNHKFGLVYPGMGSVIFKDESDVPGELVFKINYLGGEMLNYSLNFSRASSQVIMQYYNFLRLGTSGYEEIMANILANAHYLEEQLMGLGVFELLTDARYLPVVVVALKDDSDFTVFQIAERMREKGWIIPAYTLPPNAEEVAVLRLVVKENFSRDMAEMVAGHMQKAIGKLQEEKPRRRTPADGAKHRIC
ncbi:MAG: glutamate decarboxylase, partial [Desulfovibrionaceae bacterium]